MSSDVRAGDGVAAEQALGLPYAGFGLRFAAGLIDLGVVSIAAAIAETGGNQQWGVAPLALAGIGSLIGIGNSIVALGRYGQTLGMAAAGIRVTFEDGSLPGYTVAFNRLVFSVLLLPFAIITYGWMVFDRRGQTVHDKLAHTLVWRLERPPVRSRTDRAVFVAGTAMAFIGLQYVLLRLVPHFVDLCKELEITQLPPLTRMVVDLSAFATAKWTLAVDLVTACISFVVLAALGRCPTPRRWLVYVMLALFVLVLAGLVLAVALPLRTARYAVGLRGM